jgi:hypothetical protein
LNFFGISYAQNNQLHIRAKLIPTNQTLDIHQEIIFYNQSSNALDTIFLHNWANAYLNKKTPLSKRLLENYERNFFFAKPSQRGFSKIESATVNSESIRLEAYKDLPDIVAVVLNKPLQSGDSVKIDLSYLVKIPYDKFTRYGYKENNYNLRYWYITPAVYDGKWELMSNLDMDDLYMAPTNYKLEFEIPRGFTLLSDLDGEMKIRGNQVIYNLHGKDRTDIELSIHLLKDFETYETDSVAIISSFKSMDLSKNVRTDVLNRQLDFITEFLGSYPHKRLFVSEITYKKNPVYGLNQLPKKMAPFSNVFEWDIKMFKALTRKYVDNTLLANRRTDYWLVDAIQIYLMMEYVNTYYPDIKATGKISNLWFFKNYTLAKLEFNGKYPLVYQFAARKNIDQSLITRADSLSNFNRKIVNKYKAAIGLRYLDSYLNDSTVHRSIKEYYRRNLLKLSKSNDFRSIINTKTGKNTDAFFEDYLKTKKKIDYTIKSVEKENDSLTVTIRNKSNITAPVALYGIRDNEILFKRWVTGIDTEKIIKIPNKNFERLSLNYEYLYPEVNLRNNWKKVDNKILNRPVKFTFFKDIEDPYYNQVFYNVFVEYNYYDGLILGPQLYNEAMFKKEWLYQITPSWAFKSHSLIGSFYFRYQHLPENSIVYRYSAGISGSESHYDKDLSYRKLYPFLTIQFNRKSLRDVGGSYLTFRYNIVDKEIAPGAIENESDSYNVFDARYGNSQPNIIDDLRYFVDFQYSNDFSKIALDLRYRKLTDKERQLDFRLFFGSFLFNHTTSDFFSFALDRPSDYLFEYGYLGRSEDTGILSQQIIIADAGFKSIFEEKYANKWLLSSNVSMSIWRWLEVYGDAGFIKNKNKQAYFRYDSGIRFNFIHNFLEIYFPMQSSNGFEPAMPEYFSKIRYILTFDPIKIYNFARRGFY